MLWIIYTRESIVKLRSKWGWDWNRYVQFVILIYELNYNFLWTYRTQFIGWSQFFYLVADSDGQESFEGDYNDEDEYGDQTSIFDVIASSIGKTSDHPNLFHNLNESDLLEEDFISKSFLKVCLLFSVLIKWMI